jgi:hypothetical protein
MVQKAGFEKRGTGAMISTPAICARPPRHSQATGGAAAGGRSVKLYTFPLRLFRSGCSSVFADGGRLTSKFHASARRCPPRSPTGQRRWKRGRKRGLSGRRKLSIIIKTAARKSRLVRVLPGGGRSGFKLPPSRIKLTVFLVSKVLLNADFVTSL